MTNVRPDVSADNNSSFDGRADVGVGERRPAIGKPALTRWLGERPPLLVSVAFVVFVGIIAAVMAAPLIAPDPPNAQNLTAILQAPSSAHLFGTDELGRDVLSRVLYGGRPTIFLGALAVAMSTVAGVTLGVVAGYVGGWVSMAVSRIADIQLSIPALVLGLLALALFGTSWLNIVIVIAVESWPMHYRVSRSYAQTVRELAYVKAARLSGVGRVAIFRRHVLPGLSPLLAVTVSVGFCISVLTVSGLSFLGMGVQPPTPEWGQMISDGQAQLGNAWWISVFPGVALWALLLSVQIIGDWVADRSRTATLVTRQVVA